MDENHQFETEQPVLPGRKAKKKIAKWKIVVSSLGGLAVLIGGTVGVFFYELQPNQHFANPQSLPLVSTSTTSGKSGSVTGLHAGELNMLLLGVDTRVPNTPARSDSMILIHANLNTHQFDVLSIARDTRIDLPPYGMTKITHANYMGDLHGGVVKGIEEASQAVSNLTGLPINYYAEINHFGLQSLVDAIGGVTVDVPFAVPIINAWYPDLNGKTIPAGIQHLSGEMASELVHQRELLPNGDFSRQQLQEDLLLGIAKKMEKPQNWGMIPGFVNAIPKFLTVTNLSTTDMLSLALSLHGFKRSDVHYYQVPGSSMSAMDPIVGSILDYWNPDIPALNQIIKQHFMN